MRYYVGNSFYGDDFYHYGVKGQKKGVRRYQNPDGSLTDEGYSHYGRNRPQKKKTGILEKIAKKKKKAASAKKQVMDSSTIEKGKKSYVWREWSDDKLRSASNRLNLENDYLRKRNDQVDLMSTKKAKKEMSRGKEIVLTGLMNTFNNVVVTYQKAKLK